MFLMTLTVALVVFTATQVHSRASVIARRDQGGAQVAAEPCLTLRQHGRHVPRCKKNSLEPRIDAAADASRCPAGVLVDFAPAETKPGHRLVGSQRGDKYPCYPLSDDDFWRSREAVTLGSMLATCKGALWARYRS